MTAKTDAAAILANASLTLAERFIVPPVTTLDARQGYWRDRKRAWLSLGIRSEQGRGLNLLRLQHLPNTMANPSFYEYKRDLEQEFGRKLTTGEASAILAERGTIQSVDDKRGKLGRAINDHEWMLANAPGAVPNAAAGTSVFDPVLAELAYRWWCPQGGQVLDPFCGGSVRGIVASMLGRRYAGCDLRQEQIDANERQWDEMDGRAVVKAEHVRPDWRTTDALHVASEFASLAGAVDFVFTCPPYGDLEQYSDDPRDLSAMSYPAFLATYRKIIAAACGMLRQDRFAAIVVADIRDRSGNYRNFVSDTIQAFLDAGLTLYNDAVLITPFATIPLRAGKQFATGRKLTKTHQNVLVFVKGDGKAAADAVGPVECGDVPEAADLEAAESASGRVAAAAPAADEARSTPFGERMTAADLAGEI